MTGVPTKGDEDRGAAVGGHRENTAVYAPRTETSGGTSPADPLTLNFQPPGLDMKCLLLSPSTRGILWWWPEQTPHPPLPHEVGLTKSHRFPSLPANVLPSNLFCFALQTGPREFSVPACHVTSGLGLNSSTPQGRPPPSPPADQVQGHPRRHSEPAPRRMRSWPGCKHQLHSEGPGDSHGNLNFFPCS